MTSYLTHFVSAADYSIASRITTWRRFERQYTVGSSSCRFQPRMENLWSLSPRRVTVYCVIGGVWLILIPTFSSSSQKVGISVMVFHVTACESYKLWSKRGIMIPCVSFIKKKMIPCVSSYTHVMWYLGPISLIFHFLIMAGTFLMYWQFCIFIYFVVVLSNANAVWT